MFLLIKCIALKPKKLLLFRLHFLKITTEIKNTVLHKKSHFITIIKNIWVLKTLWNILSDKTHSVTFVYYMIDLFVMSQI